MRTTYKDATWVLQCVALCQTEIPAKVHLSITVICTTCIFTMPRSQVMLEMDTQSMGMNWKGGSIAMVFYGQNMRVMLKLFLKKILSPMSQWSMSYMILETCSKLQGIHFLVLLSRCQLWLFLVAPKLKLHTQSMLHMIPPLQRSMPHQKSLVSLTVVLMVYPHTMEH